MTRFPIVVPFLALSLFSLAGCTVFEPAKSPPGTPQRACEDSADADPKLRDFWATTPSNTAQTEFNADYKAARNRLIAECMRVRSGRPAGGVEKPIR